MVGGEVAGSRASGSRKRAFFAASALSNSDADGCHHQSGGGSGLPSSFAGSTTRLSLRGMSTTSTGDISIAQVTSGPDGSGGGSTTIESRHSTTRLTAFHTLAQPLNPPIAMAIAISCRKSIGGAGSSTHSPVAGDHPSCCHRRHSVAHWAESRITAAAGNGTDSRCASMRVNRTVRCAIAVWPPSRNATARAIAGRSVRFNTCPCSRSPVAGLTRAIRTPDTSFLVPAMR